MHEQALWYRRSLIPVITGLAWFYLGMNAGGWWFWIALPGVLMLAAGVALFLFAGDRRVQQFMAMGAILSIPWSLLLIPGPGFLCAILMAGLSWLCFTTSGRASILFEPFAENVPETDFSEKLAIKVAADNAVLAYFVTAAEIPDAGKCQRMQADAEALIRANQDEDWVNNPAILHSEPTTLRDMRWRSKKHGATEYRHLRFESGYQPHQALPGSEAWLASRANRYGHARVLQHDHAAPWLLCIHGYRMGTPALDFSLFDPQWLHEELGLNLLMPILPRHGPRRIGMLTGGGYIDGEVTDIVHAEAQAMHDIRSLLQWVRAEPGGDQIGVLGFSLGGYNAALLACLEAELDAVIAAIPLSDLPAALWRHLPMQQLRYLESIGLTMQRLQAALQVVSPLSLKPVVPKSRLTLLAAVADQIVPPEQAVWLRDHWGIPEVQWYQGSHMSVRRESVIKAVIENALADAGLLNQSSTAMPQSAAATANKSDIQQAG